jgi:hypothetical protein
LGDFLRCHEHFHIATSFEGGEFRPRVTNLHPLIFNSLLIVYRTSGGILMALVGIIYLAFQKKILGNSKLSDESLAPANDSFSRALVGIQVSDCI